MSYAEPLTATNTVVVMQPNFRNVLCSFCHRMSQLDFLLNYIFRLGVGTKLWTLS
jgi:hypothetical protein